MQYSLIVLKSIIKMILLDINVKTFFMFGKIPCFSNYQDFFMLGFIAT